MSASGPVLVVRPPVARAAASWPRVCALFLASEMVHQRLLPLPLPLPAPAVTTPGANPVLFRSQVELAHIPSAAACLQAGSLYRVLCLYRVALSRVGAQLSTAAPRPRPASRVPRCLSPHLCSASLSSFAFRPRRDVCWRCTPARSACGSRLCSVAAAQLSRLVRLVRLAQRSCSGRCRVRCPGAARCVRTSVIMPSRDLILDLYLIDRILDMTRCPAAARSQHAALDARVDVGK